MGFTEREVWRMTLKKLMLLWVDYQKFNGTYKEKETLDSVIPF